MSRHKAGGKHKDPIAKVSEPDERFFNPRTHDIKVAISQLSDEDQEEILAYTARIIDEGFWKSHTVNGCDRAGNLNEPWEPLTSNIEPISLEV